MHDPFSFPAPSLHARSGWGRVAPVLIGLRTSAIHVVPPRQQVLLRKWAMLLGYRVGYNRIGRERVAY